MKHNEAQRRKPLSRWLRLQFGLRSLFVFMLVVCLALGWYVERVRRQRLAVAALEKAGAHVFYRGAGDPWDDPFGPDFPDDLESPRSLAEWVEWLTPRRLQVALGIDFFRNADDVYFDEGDDFPAVVGHLRDLPAIRVLRLNGVLDEDLCMISSLKQLTYFDPGSSSITDAGIAELAKLHNLEYLDLTLSEFTDAGMACLANLRRLKHLDLSGCDVGDAGVSHLSEMSELEFLDLSYTKVTDKGLAHLAGLKRLREVRLYDTPVGNGAMAVLAELPDLESLNASRTRITDDGLPPLRRLTKLKELNLNGTAITDRGIRVIGDLAALEDIHVDGCPVTVEGAAWLRQKLPKADVCCFDSHVQEVEISRAHLLVKAGLWREGLEELRRLDPSYLQSIDGAHDLARCYAEGAQWAQAVKYYQKTLEQIAQASAEQLWDYEERLWQELLSTPQLFEPVSQARPNEFWRWIASARRSVLDGRWSEAVGDYSRAVNCPRQLAPPLGGEDVRSEYALSRLLIGDVAGHRRVSERFFEADLQEKEMHGGAFRKNWFAGTYLWFVAPQGALSVAKILDWSADDEASAWKINELEPLIYCRASMFDYALDCRRPGKDEYLGRYWFPRAMASWHLGQKTQARECYERGVRWLERRMKADRLDGYWQDAGRLLEAEVLRREAEELIFQ